MKWISVDDRLPEGNEDVLVTSDNEIAIYYYHKNNRKWDCMGDLMEAENYDGGAVIKPSGERITHWMPLPNPPK